jgi:SAM-dependent methyltransferase/uncharacterized protein YbaR (Trm112 family)
MHLRTLLNRRSATPTETRGALQLSGFDWPLARMQAELDAIAPVNWRPLGKGNGWSQIQLLEPDGRGGVTEHPALANCPAMRELAESFGARVMVMSLARLEPGGGVHEHRDLSGGISMGVLRLHVPLRTDPGVEFMVEGVRVSMREGETWHLDTTYPHAVANHSQVNRVHLIVDLEATPKLLELLPKPDLEDHLHRAEFALVVVGKGIERAVSNPKEAVDMATRFVRLRVLKQAVLTFDDERSDLADEAANPGTPDRAAEPVARPSVVPEVFACPECRARELELVDDLRAREGVAWAGSLGLRCKACKREYPYVNGVWVLWSDELAELIAAGELDTESVDVHAPDPRAIKQANFAVYQQVSEAYGEHADASVDYVDQLLLLKAHARELVEQDASGEHARVLVDVGCASGFGLDVGSAGFPTRVGVDISLANLELVAARGHIAVLADAERLPFGDGAVDLVTCFGAMHHFPNAAAFMRSVEVCLRPGGVLLTSADPSDRNMHMGPFARAAWDLRKPVYRQLARFSNRFYYHTDKRTQALNDLAEHHRTGGGFEPAELRDLLRAAGLREIEIFLGADRRGRQRWSVPSWQEAVLKGLSGRNPLARNNIVSLTTLSRKAP